jgi:hypothetical protein
MDAAAAKDTRLVLKTRAMTCDTKGVESHFAFLYDDGYSIQSFGQNLKSYWQRSGDNTGAKKHSYERRNDTHSVKLHLSAEFHHPWGNFPVTPFQKR